MNTPETTPEFIALLTSNQSRLFAYVLSLVGDRQQAQDVMQETNIVLWRKASQFKLGTNFGAWMLKVAYYQVMEQQQAALQTCLQKLPGRQRDIVRRRYREGASIKAVAEQLGIAASAIKQTLFRARCSLIDCVRFRIKEQNS